MESYIQDILSTIDDIPFLCLLRKVDLISRRISVKKDIWRFTYSLVNRKFRINDNVSFCRMLKKQFLERFSRVESVNLTSFFQEKISGSTVFFFKKFRSRKRVNNNPKRDQNLVKERIYLDSTSKFHPKYWNKEQSKYLWQLFPEQYAVQEDEESLSNENSEDDLSEDNSEYQDNQKIVDHDESLSEYSFDENLELQLRSDLHLNDDVEQEFNSGFNSSESDSSISDSSEPQLYCNLQHTHHEFCYIEQDEVYSEAESIEEKMGDYYMDITGPPVSEPRLIDHSQVAYVIGDSSVTYEQWHAYQESQSSKEQHQSKTIQGHYVQDSGDEFDNYDDDANFEEF